jgi:hypothetical protein
MAYLTLAIGNMYTETGTRYCTYCTFKPCLYDFSDRLLQRGNIMHSSPIEVQKHLKNIDYPKTKQEVIDYAINHGATQGVMDDLNDLSDKTYNNAADVSREFHGDKMDEKTREEHKHHHTTHPGMQGQNQEDESPVKLGTELHRKMTKREFIEEAKKHGASQDVIDALERLPE